jgi:hypothetical protein
MGTCSLGAVLKQTTTLQGHHDAHIEHLSGLRRLVWRQQLAQGAAQPRTELFEQVQANILLAHLNPVVFQMS